MTATRLPWLFLTIIVLSVGLYAQEEPLEDGFPSATDRNVSDQPAAMLPEAQVSSPPSKPPSENRYKNPSDWQVAIYPVMAWAPIFGVSTREFPSISGSGTGGGGGGGLLPPANASGSFNGAAFAGFRIEKSRWSVDSMALWASVSAERSNPYVRLDAHIIFGQAFVGREVLPNLFLEGGFRRMAVSLSLKISDFPELDRKPGFWDPLVGLTYRRQLSKKWRIYGHADGGGFGVGSDVDVAATARAEWQFARHFGTTFGYGLLHFKETNTVLQKSLEVSQTLNGPIFGFGIYF